jgi:capsular exopolysaccharide synthesis family protein
MVEEPRQQANESGSQRQQIEDVRAEILQIQTHRDRDVHYLEELHAQEILYKPVTVEDYGSEAQLTSDKRKLVAGLGFGIGGILPIGLMLLYGMTENRFRYSDDASTADLAGVTLLGILPNLPDRLSDPQQAGVAAHCVHQIRTMLQISSATDEPQVIAVTSASSGDGKTSLTLALGLSYAAAGARTLLVDCDLVAAGLTHRLNVNSADGVLEAVANRALLEYVRTTDIADVAILPVGTTHAHHASTLSPVALRRLLSEGRKHFDIIIIDTGPILGSIEASLVCAAADRTILAVARNQQRPIVEKSISHLISIGANLAGVVFNRAHARDFERSMSGLALRSRPAGGAPGQASAAKAVAGSFKRAG